MCTILATVAPGVCPLTHLLYLTQPHLPEPCLYPELKPGSPHCLDLPLNPEPGLTLLGSMPESGLATLSLSLGSWLQQRLIVVSPASTGLEGHAVLHTHEHGSTAEYLLGKPSHTPITL